MGLMSARVLPTPRDVMAAFLRLSVSGELLRHIAVSTARALAGLLLGGSIGFVLGLLNVAMRGVLSSAFIS